MGAFLDLCRFNPTAGGTTDWTFASVVPGYQSPTQANVFTGEQYSLRAESADLTQWEVSEGAFNGGVFARTVVLYNSAGTGILQGGAGAKINFAAAPQVAVVPIARDISPSDALSQVNILLNAACETSQSIQGNAITIPGSGPTYVLDQWVVGYANASAVVTGQQVAPPGAPAFGAAFPSCLQVKAVTALSSLAAGDYAFIYQPIEGYRFQRLGFGNANGRPVTVGFWVFATIAGTFTAQIRNPAASGGGGQVYMVNVTIKNPGTWQLVKFTIPPSVTGTWPTGNSFAALLMICLASGSSFIGAGNSWQPGQLFATASQTNFLASNNNVFCITGAAMVPGTQFPSDIRSPFIIRPNDQELPLCRRYLQFSKDRAPGFLTGSGALVIQHQAYVPIRATPTVSLTTTTFVVEVQPWVTAFTFTAVAIDATAHMGVDGGDFIMNGTFSPANPGPALSPVTIVSPGVIKFDARL